MAEYNNTINSIENNLQMISVIDNQLNYTKDFEGGYVEDMMIEEEEIFPPTNDDDEGIESDIPNNDVLVRRTTLSNSDMDGISFRLWKLGLVYLE
ncbi:hypothetical protein JTB14_024763 [Gonioctena quinquepunctata]|nr:hypothetical protein JTB14_024763 [Gonioctena quinquepunctata]